MILGGTLIHIFYIDGGILGKKQQRTCRNCVEVIACNGAVYLRIIFSESLKKENGKELTAQGACVCKRMFMITVAELLSDEHDTCLPGGGPWHIDT